MKKTLSFLIMSLTTTMLNAQTDSTTKSKSETEYNCSYRKKEVDEFTGVSKIVTDESSFISHTDSILAKYYKGKKKQYTEIESYTAKIDGMYVIYFHAVIQTKSAYDYYGALNKGSKIILKMTDGTMVDLIISKSDYGKSDYDKNETAYSIYSIIDESQLEIIRSNSIEKTRIYWAKGYQDYNCSNPDILKKQLTCLDM